MKRKRIEAVADIKLRCEEIGDCWEWTMAYSENGTPACRFDGRHDTVMRVSYQLHHGYTRENMEGLTVWASCKNQRCVRPTHMMAGSRADMMRWRGLQGLCKLSPVARAKATLARRARGVMFTMDEVREIRAAKTTEEEEGALRGCSSTLIGHIRRGQAYRETVAISSVFAMGGQPGLALESA